MGLHAAVLEFFPDKNEFVVEWHPGVGDQGGKGRRKKVSRLNLLFAGEDPNQVIDLPFDAYRLHVPE